MYAGVRPAVWQLPEILLIVFVYTPDFKIVANILMLHGFKKSRDNRDG